MLPKGVAHICITFLLKRNTPFLIFKLIKMGFLSSRHMQAALTPFSIAFTVYLNTVTLGDMPCAKRVIYGIKTPGVLQTGRSLSRDFSALMSTTSNNHLKTQRAINCQEIGQVG